MVPPIKLWDRGVPNESALKIMTRNSRMPDSLAADLDAECSACLAGARRLGELFDRYGVAAVEACFEAILSSSTEVYRREILSQIPDGTYVWEDYAEHDGVEEPQLHRQRITLIMDSSKETPLVIDFTGTGPQAKGPINHCGDYADGNFLKKWLAPILRNLAETPERMAQLDVNEGVVPLIEMRFPEKGTLLTPIFPAPTNARTFVILRLLGVLAGVLAKATGGRMPADQETIRYTGVYGTDFDGEPYLMREVLGGGSGGRFYADGEDTIHVVPDSRNLPTEFTEGRFPLRVERLGLALDSGGAGRYRGGCGYEKHIRVLRDAHFMSIADRSILACWGVKGGKAGRPFQVTVDPGGPDEHDVDALADAEPLKAGTVVRIRTTGGGGWGDPLDRPVDEVLRDIAWRKVSVAGAREDYGVVVRDDGTADEARHRGTARGAAGLTHRRGTVLRPRPRLRDPLGRRGVQRVRRPLGRRLRNLCLCPPGVGRGRGSSGSGGAQLAEGAGQPGDLVEHGLAAGLELGIGHERVVLVEELREERDGHRLDHGDHAQRTEHRLQRGRRAQPGGDAAVRDDPRGLVRPLERQVVQRVLQRARERVVVLGRDEDERVAAGDGRGPLPGVLLRVLLQARVVRLVEDRQADVGDVDELDVEAAVLLGQLLQPGPDRDTPPPGTGTGDDDLQNGVRHEISSLWLTVQR